MPVGVGQGDEDRFFRQRISLFLQCDGRLKVLHAFVQHFAEDDELHSGKELHQFPMCFIELRQNRFQGKWFHDNTLSAPLVPTQNKRGGRPISTVFSLYAGKILTDCTKIDQAVLSISPSRHF